MLALDGSLERELIFQRHADEYGHAEIVVVQEGAKAGIAIAIADQPQLIGEKYRSGPKPRVVPITHVDRAPDEIQRQQGHDLQYPDDVAIRIAEQNRGGPHADLNVVLSIDHRVDRVVYG